MNMNVNEFRIIMNAIIESSKDTLLSEEKRERQNGKFPNNKTEIGS
jgi:hypothetical protein